MEMFKTVAGLDIGSVFTIKIGRDVNAATAHHAHLAVQAGERVEMTLTNRTDMSHPMHLHGFYFRVDARGTMARDTTFVVGMRRLAVTEPMPAFTTMAMTWIPERPGNWLFHCHLSFHVVADARLDAAAHGAGSAHTSDPRTHMAGLVLGIAVEEPVGALLPERRGRHPPDQRGRGQRGRAGEDAEEAQD